MGSLHCRCVMSSPPICRLFVSCKSFPAVYRGDGFQVALETLSMSIPCRKAPANSTPSVQFPASALLVISIGAPTLPIKRHSRKHLKRVSGVGRRPQHHETWTNFCEEGQVRAKRSNTHLIESVRTESPQDRLTKRFKDCRRHATDF
jgi:hypothetical protein